MSHNNFIIKINLERGFLVPTALFIVVGLGALAISIARMAGSANSMALREALSAQAFFAAESGVQLALYNLYNGATTRALANTNCSTLDVASRTFTSVGLKACTVVFDCATTTDTGNTRSFYLITATASCGSSDLATSRVLNVKAIMQ
ncbi:MAG TPA: MSHA biogenesis protein MshP [Cellvibrionaceae bacterium]